MEKTQEPKESQTQQANRKMKEPKAKNQSPLEANQKIGEPKQNQSQKANQNLEEPKIRNQTQLQTKQNITEPKQDQTQQQKQVKPLVWDCGSTLYDSFELNSFKRQLDSAITSSSRTLSMSRLPDRRAPPPESKKPSKISRSLHKLLKSMFNKSKQSSCRNTTTTSVFERSAQSEYYVVYDKTGALTTIPEVPEIDNNFAGLSPEINSLVRRTASERYTATTSIGISCA